MKQLSPSQKERKSLSIKNATITAAFSFITMMSFSQGLIFKNPTLASGAEGCDKTFSYTAAKASTLPVMFESFTAQLNSSNIKTLLNWATTSGLSASRFIVQRSADGGEYEDVAIVFSQEGNSTLLRQYSYSDNISMVNGPIAYYRL